MNSNYKIIALDLQNATLENLNHWFITSDFITAEATKDYLRYRVKDEENTIHLFYIINDFLFGTTSKEDYPFIVIPEYLTNDIVEYCIPIQLSEIESYRSVIIDWIFNTDTTRSKTAFEIKPFQKYTVDFYEMNFPDFISCVTCVDVEELGFNLKEFFQPLNQKFKAIHTEFKKYYPSTQYLQEVKLTKIYILEKYILGYSFRLENEPYEHFFYNIHLESLLHQIKPFQFDDKPKLTVDSILEKISQVGVENLTKEEQEFLNKQSNMIKISNPLIKQGELITHYNGYNRKINQSEQHLTSQRIKFITSQELNGGDEANYCFEFKLLNRKFLMVLDQEKLYEILEDGEDKVYVLLTESWFYILKSFEEGKKIVTQITLTLHYEYTPQAEFHENFDVQLNMRNEPEVKYWFSKIRPREDDM